MALLLSPGPICLFSTFSVLPSTFAGFLFRCSALCAMLPLYPSQYELPHTHLTDCDPMSCCDVTKDQNAAVVFHVKQQTCMCATFELLLGVTSCPPSRTPYTRDVTIFYISTLSMLFDICDQSCWQSCVTPIEIRVDVLALCIPFF